VIAALVLFLPPRWIARAWGRGPDVVDRSQALNVWIIQAIVAIGPPLGGLIFTVYMKSDWGISLFFLAPLALIAIPRLRMRVIAVPWITAIYLLLSLATLAAAPSSRWSTIPTAPTPMARARSWHAS
jgi:hypothetical protein